MPVTINHPSINGRNVPFAEYSDQRVGILTNVEWDESGKKLRGQVLLLESLLQRHAPVLIKRLQSGKPIEVSTGLYTEDEDIRGTWNETSFYKIARNHVPDHLAILTDLEGACSVKKGCGLAVANHYSPAKDNSMCHCHEVLTPFGIAIDGPQVESVPVVNADDDDIDITPPSTFNSEKYQQRSPLAMFQRAVSTSSVDDDEEVEVSEEVEAFDYSGQGLPLVNAADEDDFDITPPSTFRRS